MKLEAHSIVKLKKKFYSGIEGRPDVFVAFVDRARDLVVVRYQDGTRHEVPHEAVLESSILKIGGFNYLQRFQKFPAFNEIIKSPKLYERLKLYYPDVELEVVHNSEEQPQSDEDVSAVQPEQNTDEIVVLLRDIKNSLAELVEMLR